MRCRPTRLIFWLLTLNLFSAAVAENIVFPDDAGVIDVTKAPYLAKGDGRTDDSEAIQQALLENPNGNRIIYLPNGTYRLTTTLRWPNGEGDTAQRATILQGQSREGTRLELLDYSPGFSNPGRARPMLWTGGEHQHHHRNAVRNLTLHTGVGNPGAVGLQFKANEQGCIRDVTVIAGGKGDGVTGVDVGHVDFNGPVFLKNVLVDGFDVGLRAAFSVFSINAESVQFENQQSAAIRNRGQVMSIRHLTSSNRVPAVLNTDPTGMISLLDSRLVGLPAKRPSPAVENRGLLFLRDLVSVGCTNLTVTNLVENEVGTGEHVGTAEVDEFFSHRPFNMFPAPFRTLRLPVKETPEVVWDPLARWSSPLQFGGRPDDNRDDSQAIQAAIDSGAGTVYLPNGTWVINSPVEVRGNVHRIIGCEAKINLATLQGGPAFKILGPTNEPMVIERLEIEPATKLLIQHASERPLVVSSCLGANLAWPGSGEVFLEDVQSGLPLQMGEGRRLWARSWSSTFEGTKLINDGGQAWLFGFKTGLGGCLVETSGGGKTELLGGLCNSSGVWKSDPMFRIRDASAIFIVGESSFNSTPFQTIATEVRNGVTRALTLPGPTLDHLLPQRVGGVALPLYSAFDGVGNVIPRIAQPINPKSGRP
jgi:hypothetical protein